MTGLRDDNQAGSHYSCDLPRVCGCHDFIGVTCYHKGWGGDFGEALANCAITRSLDELPKGLLPSHHLKRFGVASEGFLGHQGLIEIAGIENVETARCNG